MSYNLIYIVYQHFTLQFIETCLHLCICVYKLYKLIHPIYIANRKTKTVVYLLSIAVVINIVLNLILIPQYNAYGAAVASIVSYSVCGIAFYVKFKNDFEIKKTEIISKIITIFK